MLTLTIKPGQSVQVGDAVVRFIGRKGKGIRLGFICDEGVPVSRLGYQDAPPVDNTDQGCGDCINKGTEGPSHAHAER